MQPIVDKEMMFGEVIVVYHVTKCYIRLNFRYHIAKVQPYAAILRIAPLWLTCWTTDFVVSSVMQVTSFPWVYHAW
jgi:hypothetical protein